MLRPSGCALLFSYVRSPRLPMLDERPPEEPPARASAMAGAKATLAQKNSASMMRQFSSRLAIVQLAQNLKNGLMRLHIVCAGAGGSTAERNITAGAGRAAEWSRAGREPAHLLDWPITRAQIRYAIGCRTWVRFASLAHE
jgi:hypothetical protein